MYKSSLEFPTALVTAFDAKTFNDAELLKSCLPGGNRITVLIFSDKPTENITVKYLTKDTVHFISASRPSTEYFIRRVPCCGKFPFNFKLFRSVLASSVTVVSALSARRRA